jgi:hypothetical protein
VTDVPLFQNWEHDINMNLREMDYIDRRWM